MRNKIKGVNNLTEVEVESLEETSKYMNMLAAFACDFNLAVDGTYTLDGLQEKIDNEDKNVIADIDLLNELERRLRMGQIKIVKVSMTE